MQDHLIRQDLAGQVADELMHVDDDPTGFIGAEAPRFDMGVDRGPLAAPVLTDRRVAMDAPALHPVRPVHIGMHEGEDGVDVASIEGPVGGAQKILFFHRGHGLTREGCST